MTLVNKNVSRRGFLKGSLAAAAGMAALPAFNGLGLLAQNGRVEAAPGRGGYGPLIPTADERDGVVRLSVPEGFKYRSFGVSGDMMSDGELTPVALDGMAVFNVNGRFRLVRNHEDRNAMTSPNRSVRGPESTKYNPLGGGGTTTLVVNPFTRELEQDWTSLNGTIVNCAGGPTPWGSWISCEETNANWGGVQHGYCFEVPAEANSTVQGVAIPDMGRFSHEAVAVDPATGYVYETEDNGRTNSGFYRYSPNTPGVLQNGGMLQMLGIEGISQFNAYTSHPIGLELPAVWYDIANPNPSGTSSTAVFNQGRSQGGAAFDRLEGCWYGNGAIYFASTSGGTGWGQIWEYRPTGQDTGVLRLIFESPNQATLNMPDNLAVSPQGALLLCEDGSGNDQYLRGLTQNGELFDFAYNLENGYEWAGACFADADPSWNAAHIRGSNRPLGGRWDRVTLFVNRQGQTSGAFPPAPANAGMTFAIWGPWGDGAL